ncbi:MAG TPA: L-histidine N(alpha)-methyltransferase, partial [Candidatus Saccharimonadales bacterium]|nr:L-histidine N(alpha)-methyltransferase [Candidatus Saccharimonadales bacterium]
NTKAVKTITPKPEFYKLFTEAQIYDIITNLEIHHEIPRQYNYFDGGASDWDRYSQRLASENIPNVINKTVDLLAKNQSRIEDLLGNCKRINVMDIGPGNALPAKALLQDLLQRGKLGRYIALDISPEMLKIAKRNIREWFHGEVAFEGYELDINYDRFNNILAEEYIRHDANDSANLVLLLGGTLSNFRKPEKALDIVHDSMNRKDLLIYTYKLDTEISRSYFDFNVNPGEPKLPPIHSLIVNLLNIDKTHYDLLLGYDEQTHQRYEKLRFKVALTLKVKFDAGERLLSFNKGDSILVWRAWQCNGLDIAQQFDRSDLHTLHSSQTEDEQFILTVSRVKCE